MWRIILGLSLGLLFLLIIVLLYRKYLRFPLDTAEARRNRFPINSEKRSHPAPQFSWHPALKITKQSYGVLDDDRIEKNLCVDRGYFTIQNYNLKIFWQSYRPKRKEDVTHGLVMLHGYSDHSDYSIRQIAMTHATLNNSWVFTFDYPGHGRSDGLWGFIGDWANLILQIAEIVDNLFVPKVQEIQKPLFCWGGSQGGAVAIYVCMSHPNLFSGAVLVCPMCDIGEDVSPPACAVSCLKCLSNIVGWLPVVPGKDHSLLTFEDPNVYESQKFGPNCNKLAYAGKPRLATGRELLRATTEIISRCETEMMTPFLLIHGDNDTVCPIQQSREFYNMAKVKDKVFEEIPGGWHAVLEKDLAGIYQLMFEWINTRLEVYPVEVEE